MLNELIDRIIIFVLSIKNSGKILSKKEISKMKIT